MESEGACHSIVVEDKDRLIADLKGRIAALENELRQNREKAGGVADVWFRSILDTSLDVLYRLNMKTGRFEYVSPSIEAVTGYTPEDILVMDARSALALIHPDDQPAMQEAKKQLEVTGKSEAVYRQRAKNGEYRWISNHISLTRDAGGRPLYQNGNIRDITAQKRAEEALRETRAQLLSIMDNSQDLLYRCDIKTGRYFYISPAAEGILGFPIEELMSMTMSETMATIHPGDRAIAEPVLARIVSEGKGRWEYRAYTRSGECRWLSNSISIIYDEAGRPLYRDGIVQDITGRKRTEESLRLIQFMVNHASESIIVLDPGGRYVFANETGRQVLGYSSEELMAMRIWDIDPNFDEAAFRMLFGQVKLLGQSSFESIHRTRSGHEFPVEVSLNFFSFEGNEYLCGFARDITRRKRMEMALRETLIKAEMHAGELHALVASIADAMMVVDKAGNIAYMNSEAIRIFGYSPADYRQSIAVRSLRLRACFPDGTPLKPEDMLTYRALQGETVNNVELVFNRADANPLWIIASAAPIRDGSGSITGAVITLIDNTKRKQAEEALKIAKTQAELYLDLMGHDLNNMHQIALGFLEMARDTQPDGRQMAFLDKPIEVLNRSAQLIQNVRKLQKLNEGVLRSHEVNLYQVLADVGWEFGEVSNRIIVLNPNGCEKCVVIADDLLHDVFANLVSNAIKHTGDRTTVSISLEQVAENGVKYCRVSVEDDGPGIPDDLKDKIFDRMLRGTSLAKGMGLGLYLVKSLIKSYQGRIWVEDRVPGDHTRGARFVVLLPAVEN